MKRIITVLLTMSLLLAVLVLPMTSCSAASRLDRMDEEERAYALYRILAQSLRDAHSFTVTSEMELTTRVNGQGLTLSYSTTHIGIDQGGAGRLDYSSDTFRTRLGGVHGEVSERRTESGYADGYIFRAYEYDGERRASKTALPYGEYAAEYKPLAESLLLDMDLWEAKDVTCEKREDGTRRAVFKKLNAAGLETLEWSYGVDMSMISDYIYIADASIEITATPELLFDTVRVTLIYNEVDPYGEVLDREYPVVCEQTFAYGPPAAPPAVDLSSYGDIGDLTVPDDVFYALDERIMAPRGSYTVSSRNTVTEDGETTMDWLSDTEMDFDTYESGLVYDAEMTYGYEDELYRIQIGYEDGVMTTRMTDPETGEDYGYSDTSSEEEVRRMIADEIAPRDLSSEDIIRIETRNASAGEYRLHLGGGVKTACKTHFSSQGGSMGAFEAYIDVTLKDGELLRYELHVVAEGFTDTAESYRYELVTTCVFRDRINRPETV